MTKRILAMLLALAMVLTLLPAVVVAEEEAPAQHVCEHCDQTPEWVSWDGTAAMEDGKHYVLSAQKLELSSPIALSEGTYVLCLNGNTISGAVSGRIFDLSGTASLIITDHTATGEGEEYEAGKLADATNSAVAVSGNASFTMYDGIMENNKRTSGDGGAIRCDNGQGVVNIYGGLFRNNHARYGAVVYMLGNRANQWTVQLHLENALITGNTSSSTGAIHCEGLTKTLIKDTEISGNTTTGTLTGGMYVTSAEADLTLSGKVIIDDNTNRMQAANIINRNLILNNAATVLKVDGLAQGSRIQLKATKGTDPTQVIVPANQTSWDCGWIILGEESVTWNDANNDGKVEASEFTAGHYHNGVKYTAVTGNTTLPTDAGNYYLTQDVTLANVAAFDKTANLCLNGHEIRTKSGRILQLTKSSGAVLSIEDCTAYTDDTGVYHAGAITGANFTSSGAVYVNAGTTLKLYGGKISGNTAQAGAGIYVNGGTAYMYGGEISGNKAAAGSSNRLGGGVCVMSAGAAFYMEGGTIRDNTAAQYGGGVYAGASTTVQITGGTITGNTAAQGGGVGINGATGTLGNVTVSGNTATTEGGGLWLTTNASATLDGAVITGNESPAGAGVAVRASQATMKSGKINNNTCSSTGGGVFVNGDGAVFTLEDGQISGNEAKFGGGAMVQTKGKITMTGGAITKNESTAQGGGVYASTNTNFYMEGGTISENTAARNGGGIYNLSSTSHISGGIIENNISKENGGGIAMSDDTATLNLSGGTITGNTAVASGGIHTTATSVVNISGAPKVVGNAAGGKASNLCLEGDSLLMQVGEMQEGAQVSISGVPYRAISAPVATDCSGSFASDSTLYAVKYVEGALYLDVAVEHKHCVCGGASGTGCDHAQLEFAPWESNNSLPSSGNYYLTADVVVSAQTRIENATLNLCLNGHTVKVGDQGGRVFYLTNGGKLNITDCAGGGKLTGATSGAILTDASGTDMELNLYSGSITENHSVESGGAIILQGDSTFHMYGGQISGNSAADGKHGGGIILLGGAEFKQLGGEIRGNTAGGNGGGIYANGGSMELVGGKISGNTATKDGGGVYLNKSAAALSGTTVENNSAVNGAGICVYGTSELTVSGGKISGNKAGDAGVGGGIFNTGEGAKTVMTGGEISGNTAKAGGGVITQTKSAFTLEGGIITDNKAGTSGGGGVYISTNTSFTMTGGQITKNESAGAGGGLYLLRSTANITGGEIIGNTAQKEGGGIVANGGSFKLEKATVSGNSGASNGGGIALLAASQKNADGTNTSIPATAELGSGAAITGNSTPNTGGGVFVSGEGSAVVVSGSVISKNTAKFGGGILTQTKSSMTIKSGSVTENKATSNGGGVYISTNTTLNMEGGQITKNESAGAGGGLYLLRSTANITGGDITGNTAKKEGGGIAANGGSIKLEKATVSGNSAATNGGGIALLAASQKNADGTNTSIPATAELGSGAAITGNSAVSTGGGVFVSGEGSALVVSGGVISKNTAKFGAGAITQTKSSMTLKSGQITENKSTSNGGGLYISTNTTLNLEGGEISKNSSQANGGGIYFLKSNLNMTGGKVSGNTAKTDGGGMYMYITNSVFKGGSVTGNSAKNAGGIRMTGGKHSISGLTVSYNTAESDGGGIQIGRQMVKENGVTVDMLPEFTIYSGSFVGNKAKNGGAMLLLSNKAVYTIYNAYIAENEASNGGGGIYVSTGATLNMYGGTITRNYGKTGGGIMMLLSTGNYENVEITDNTGNNAPGVMINKKGEHGDIHMKNVKINNNVGAASGAVVVQGEKATLHMEDCQMNGNSTEKTGGALFTTTKAETYVKNTEFKNNTAGTDAGAVMLGLNSVLELDGCTFEGNSAGGNGGAIYNRGLMHLSNSQVLNNTSGKNGGGIGSGKTGAAHTGTKCGLYIDNVVSSGNVAEGNGGGLYGSIGCHVVAKDLTLTDNTAKGIGGGAWAAEDFIVENLKVTGNTASQYAVYLDDSEYDGQSYIKGIMKFTGLMIVQDNQGGGVYLGENTTLTLAGDGPADGSYMDVTLHSGLLTQKVFGVYGYSGGDLNYTVTTGNRSILEPEFLQQSQQPEPDTEPTQTTEPTAAEEADDIGLYLGICGIAAVILIAAVLLVIVQKKKSANAKVKE